jgi:hypothetical protein
MTVLNFSGTPNDTLSNPWYDYASDSIYVGASNGTLHKFNPVFTGIPQEVTTSPWPVTLDATNTPASPVYDSASGCVFVGDANETTSGASGYLYSVNSGAGISTNVCGSSAGKYATSNSQLDTDYGIQDGPLVDSTAETVYVFVGYDGSSDGVYQFTITNFPDDSVERQLGASASGKTTLYQLVGTFDNQYYASSSSTPTGNLYVCTTDEYGVLYQVPILANKTQPGVAGPELSGTIGGDGVYGRCSPESEFFNSSTGGTAVGWVTIQSDPGTWTSGANTVTIGSTTYKFVTSLTAVNQVLVSSGSTATNDENRTAQNLYAVINATSSECSTSSCVYTGQTVNASVTATEETAPLTNVVVLTSKTSGSPGSFTLSTNYSTGINVSGGVSGTDYLFLSIYSGTQTNCTTDTAGDGCVMSFNITSPTFNSSFAAAGAMNLSSVDFASPTGGIIIDNALTTPSGASQIYFLTQDTAGTAIGSTSCSGICGAQASQAGP